MEYSRQNVLGVQIGAIDMPVALDQIRGWIENKERQYICVAPAHSVMDAYKSPELRTIMNMSGMVTPDGMGIVWLLKLFGHRHVRRVYGPDLVKAVCGMGVRRGYRHFFYGGEDGVARGMASKLVSLIPGLQIAGMHTPPRGTAGQSKDDRMVELINSHSPDIVWIGLSSPKQEYWMAEHLGRIQAPVMIGVGAAFDFIAGTKPQAPRWVQRSGFEWLFRLISEPRRLWPRYRQYPKFVLLALAQLLGLKDYPIEE
jgi:N-acetylglucosaminyldiphosphoundecaprenol N-acetyl-beta-D-mannosaminyltransferase